MGDLINIMDVSINNKFIDNDDEYVFNTDKDGKTSDNSNKKNSIDLNLLQQMQQSNQQVKETPKETTKEPAKETIKAKKQKTNEKETIITIDNEVNNTNDSNDTNASRDVDDSDKSLDNNTMLALKKIGSKTFRTHIMTTYIRPRMQKDIEYCFVWRDKWSKISNIFFSLSEIICIIQTIMAFTASSYNMQLLSFLAGMLGVLCISFNRFGTYAKNASSESTSQLNEVLGTIGIKDEVPDLMDNDYGENDKKKK